MAKLQAWKYRAQLSIQLAPQHARRECWRACFSTAQLTKLRLLTVISVIDVILITQFTNDNITYLQSLSTSAHLCTMAVDRRFGHLGDENLTAACSRVRLEGVHDNIMFACLLVLQCPPKLTILSI